MKGYKRYFAFAVILGLIFSVLYRPIPVFADNDFIDDLVYYALTVSGYMETHNFTSSGGGHSFGKPVDKGSTIQSGQYKGENLFTKLKDAFQYAYDNHNISVDDNGSYIFDETITNNFYNIVNGGVGIGGYNAKFISQFNSEFLEIKQLANSHFWETVENNKPSSDYLMGYSICTDNKGKHFCVYIYDISNVDYYSRVHYNSGDGLQAYSFDDGVLTLNVTRISQGLDKSGNYYTWSDGDVAVENKQSTGIVYLQEFQAPFGYSYLNWYNPRNSMNYDLLPGVDLFCMKPMIIGYNPDEGRGGYIYLNNPLYLIPNTFETFPSITGDQITNTNWQNCYNSYVNNVNNTYNENHTEWNKDDFIGVMNTQNNLIIESLNKGVADITGAVESLNEKLQRVLDTIKEIKEIIANGGSGGSSGGGGSSFTDEQITQLLNDVKFLSENQVTTTNFDETLNNVNEYLKQISENTENNHDDLEELKSDLEKLYNFLLYGDEEKGFDSPYEIIQNLYSTVLELSADLTSIKNDDAQLKLYVADLLQIIQRLENKEDIEIDYSNQINDIKTYLENLNTSISSETNVGLQDIKDILLRLENACDRSNGVDLSPIVAVLTNIETKVSNIEFNYIDKDYNFDFDIDIKDPSKVKDLMDTFVDDALSTALQAAVPFCFVVALGTLFDMLAVEPTPPSFVVPFGVSDTSLGVELGVDSDYEMGLDFADWEGVHAILENMFIILFIILLMWTSFRLIKFAVSVFV